MVGWQRGIGESDRDKIWIVQCHEDKGAECYESGGGPLSSAVERAGELDLGLWVESHSPSRGVGD